MPEDIPPEEFDLLAAELALGLLEGEDRVRALRLRLSDRSFRMAVSAWQDRLAPMFAEVPDAEPRPDVWSRVAALLEDRAPNGVVRKLRAWRIGAFAASAVAAGLALLILFAPLRAPRPPQPAQPVAIAQLLDKSGRALLLARLDGESGKLRVQAIQLPEDARVPELWVIPPGGAPLSLGLIGRSGSSDLAADARSRALLRPGSVIAVTLEPADGAPHRAPTGEILGSAPLTAL